MSDAQEASVETVNVNDRDFSQQPQETEKKESNEVSAEALPDIAESESPSIDDLPLPESDKSEKGELPKWAEKRLSKKDREIAQKAAEAEMYKAELEKFRNTAPVNQPQFDAPELSPPRREDFETEDDYIDARIDYKQHKASFQNQQMQRQHAFIEAEQNFRKKWNDTYDVGAKKYDDFEDVTDVLNHPTFPSNRGMAEAIVDSDHRHDILYFLGTHADKAREIARMNPVQAIKEIAKLEARFIAARKPNTTKASAPIVPLKANQGQVADGDPTKMGQEDYVEWYEKKFGKKRLLK